MYHLKGQCHEIFCYRFFSLAPENNSRVISNFFENSRRYAQVKMHRYQQHRRHICHRYQWHRRANFATEKIRNGPILRGLGETDSWKKPEAKIWWHCPFKRKPFRIWLCSLHPANPMLPISSYVKHLSPNIFYQWKGRHSVLSVQREENTIPHFICHECSKIDFS